eukprot:185297-Prymnesium_polylepis.1
MPTSTLYASASELHVSSAQAREKINYRLLFMDHAQPCSSLPREMAAAAMPRETWPRGDLVPKQKTSFNCNRVPRISMLSGTALGHI